MQQKNKKRFAALLLSAFVSTMLVSFSPAPGGDSFEIYVNNKLVYQRYLHEEKALQTLTWTQSNYNDKVDIYYSHCGTVGKSRVIAIKDAQNNILKKWTFADAKGNNKAMSCTVKDILNAGKNSNTIYLYYTSAELPKGKLLAAVKGS